MIELNKEQQWLADEIDHWPIHWEAATRGPFDEILNVYPRKCTKDYCLTRTQWIEYKNWMKRRKGDKRCL
jgi:hypothetical protein